MGNRIRQTGTLAALVTALCLSTTSAWAQSITMSTVSGSAGSMVNVTATLATGGVTPGVAGTQNDFDYDPTKVAVVAKMVCKGDPTTDCTMDSDCGTGDTCIGVPNCTVNSAIKKEATAFAFLPPNCSGTACTGVRALVFSLVSPNRLIPDGSVLYTCPVGIPAGTANGSYPLTIAGVVLSFPSPPGGQVPGTTGVNGAVDVGVAGPTNTPGGGPTNTPSGPTNTPGGPTNTPSGPTNTPSGPTNTPGGPTNTPSGPTNTPGGGGPSPTPTSTPLPVGPGISIGTANGDAGTMVEIGPVLHVGGVTPGVAGTQNDINYESTKIAVVAKKVCKGDPTTDCTMDSDCGAGDTCVEVPNCTVNTTIKKEATAFAFLPPNCSGTACTGVRALVFSLVSPNRLIPDGSVLYTCPVKIVAGTANGTYPLTCAGTVLSFPSPPGGQVPGVTCDNGSVIVGPIPPTNTPGGATPTKTPGGPTNTPNTPGGPTHTPGGPTNTPGGPTSTPGGPTRTPTHAMTATTTGTPATSPTPRPTVSGVVAEDAAIGSKTLVLEDASGFGSSGIITEIDTPAVHTVSIVYLRDAGSNTLNLATPLLFAVPAGSDVIATVNSQPSSSITDSDGCSCRIATPAGSQRSWLLVIPVAALLVLRRRRR